MENLLASIRQQIDTDLGEAVRTVRQPTAASIKGAMEELRAKVEPLPGVRGLEVSSEINELREKINRNRSVPPEPKTPFAQIMAGQVRMPPVPPRPTSLPVPVQQPPVYVAPSPPSYQQPGYHQEPAYSEQGGEDWQDQAYAAEQGYEQDSSHLLSDESSYAAQSSFNELAQALMARAMGERSIEDLTQELLRTMLRNWLDANLPSLVERLVREEIERVARRGR